MCFRFSFVKENTLYYVQFDFASQVDEFMPAFKQIFESGEKISTNIKEQIVFLKQNFNINYSGAIFDVALAAYISQPSEQSYAL